MADQDNIIRATTSVDTSGLKSGMSEAVDVTSSSLAILQEKYRTASTEVRQSVNRIVDAEKQAAEAIALGHKQIAATLQTAADSERVALDGLIAKQEQLNVSLTDMKVALGQAKGELQGCAEAALEDAAATYAAAAATENLAKANTHVVGEVAAASGAIRVLEGTLPIRAVERFAVTTLGLGPILQAAFPIVGAVALGEIIYRTWERFDPLIKAEKDAAAATKKLDEEFAQLEKRFERLQIEKETAAFGKLAGAQLAAFYSQTDIEQDKGRVADIERRISELQSKLRSGQLASGVPGFIGMFFTQRDEAAARQQLAVLEAEKEKFNFKITVDEQAASAALAKAHKDQLDDQKRAAREAIAAAKEAARERIDAVRASEQDALDTLKASHKVTVDEEIEFWERMRAADLDSAASSTDVLQKAFLDRAHVISNTLGNLYQAQDRELAASEERQLRIRETAERAAAESITRINEAQKKAVEDETLVWEQGGKRTLQSTIERWQGIAATYNQNAGLVREALEKVTAAEQRLREEQRRISDEQTKGQGASAVSGLQGQRQAVQRAGDLDLDQTIPAKIRTLEQLKVIDAEIIAEQIKTAKALAQNDLADPVKYASDLNQIVKLQEQADQKIYADQTNILKLTQQQYTNFFNQINQGFQRAIDQMLTSHRTFASGLRAIGQTIVLDFYHMVEQRVLRWIEGTALIKAAEAAWSAAMIALHITTAVTTQGISTAAAIAQITTSAAVGAAGAAAAVAPIPFVGPALAPGAAATMETLIMSLAAFEGGGIVPNTGIAMVHGGEAVLPAHLTSMLMNVANGGNSFTNNGGIHVHGSGGANGRQQGRDILSEISAHMRRNNMQMA